MSVLLHRWSPLLVLVLALIAPAAWADVTVPTPRGWSSDANAPRAALAEAEEWASATELEARQVASPNESDQFVENLVVLLDRRPLRPEVLEDEAVAIAALTDLANDIFDASGQPTDAGIFETGATTGIRARWEVEGTTWDLLLVPSGAEHALVVLKTASANQSLHGDLIDEIVSGLDGASPPIPPFPLGAWRWSLLPLWLVIAGVSHGVALMRNDHAGDQLAASRKSSIWVVLAAVVLTGIAYVALSGRAVELDLAGTSATGAALEMLGAGLVAAVVLVVLGRVAGSGPERVESAPRTGVFSAEVPSTPPPGPGAARTEKSPVPRQLGPDADADVGDFHSRERPRGS